MKKIMYTLVLILGIKGMAFGQENGTSENTTPGGKDNVFGFSDGRFHTRFLIRLEKENKVRLDLLEHKDLARLPDIDSLLRIFIQDMVPFRDSLSDELTTKRIDYKVDSSGRREIRIRQFAPPGSSYVIDKGNLAALKLDQDTVYILSHFYRVTVLVNRLGELPALVNGTIDEKIRTLRQSRDEKDWVQDKNDNRVHLRTDPDISARLPSGNRIQPNDMLGSLAAVSIQNYKSWFVPSFDLGVNLVIHNFDWKHDDSRFKYVIDAYWEPQFLFLSTPGGLKTYRNDFIVLSWGYGLKDPSVKDKSPLRFDFSIGYLVGNRGGFYAPHTFRVGLDEVPIFKDKMKVQPVVYFNDFFKGVTPGLRITRSF
jgi:hypothetical protein